MKKQDAKIAVIGAGLTGLTTAYYLKKHGIKFRVFEKAERAGGVIQTHRENGFIFESGPNTGALSRGEAAELFEELKHDCTLEIADENAKDRWILKNGKWHSLPAGLLGGIKTPLFSWSDKFRLLLEPFRKSGTNPEETIADLVRRRMGKSFLNYAVDPFISGVYSGDPEKLVTQYAIPKLWLLEQNYGSFIGGTIKKRKEPKPEIDKKATRQVFSFKGGMDQLANALVKNIGEENICLNWSGKNINQTEKSGFEIEGQHFTHVISTAGSYQLAELFPFIDSDKLAQINQLEYAKVTQVTLGFKNWNGIAVKSFGGLIPSKEKRDILGILFMSSFLKNRAPEKGVLFSVFLGGVRRPEITGLSNEEIMKLVKKEVTELMGLEEFNPDLVKIFRYKHAIPQYSFESKQKLEAITELENLIPGLVLAGNIRDGIGMADRIKQGKNVADQLNSQLS